MSASSGFADGWEAGSPMPHLDADAVHLWWGEVRPPSVERASLWLSDDEHARAARFRVRADRDRYVVGRGGLRHLVARYTGSSLEAVRFRYGHRGKPMLAGPACDLHVNLAHAGGWVLWGITRAQPIGVDLEPVRPEAVDAELCAAVLTADEQAWLRRLSAGARAAAFFRCWTLKEALVKAHGVGFEHNPPRLNVLAAAQAGAMRFRWPSAAGLEAEWCVRVEQAPPECCAALARRGSLGEVSRFRFTDGAP